MSAGPGPPTRDDPFWRDWFGWRDPLEILPDEAFDRPCNHERFPRTALGEALHDLNAAIGMAGWAFRPTFVEFADACVRENRTPPERGYIRELIMQVHPFQQRLLMRNMGVTVFELARALRDSGVDHRNTTGWINRYADGYESSQLEAKAALHRWIKPPPKLLIGDAEYERLASTPV